MLKEIQKPDSVGFFADRIERQKVALRQIDNGALPVAFYEGIPIGKLRSGIIFSIYSDYTQIRDMGNKSLANTLIQP